MCSLVCVSVKCHNASYEACIYSRKHIFVVFQAELLNHLKDVAPQNILKKRKSQYLEHDFTHKLRLSLKLQNMNIDCIGMSFSIDVNATALLTYPLSYRTCACKSACLSIPHCISILI